MTARDFCFWLQGYVELTPGQPAPLSAEQVDKVRRHLALVFVHDLDPTLKSQNKRIEELAQKIHDDLLKPQSAIIFDPPKMPWAGSPIDGGPQMRC